MTHPAACNSSAGAAAPRRAAMAALLETSDPMLSQQRDFGGIDVTAVGHQQLRPQEIVGEEVMGRGYPSNPHDGFDLLAALGQVDGIANAVPFRQLPAAAQQVRGAGLRSVGRQEAADPSLFLAMPGLHQIGAALQAGVGPGVVKAVVSLPGVGFVRVVDVFCQYQPQARGGQIGGVLCYVGGYFQQAGDAAADGFQDAQQGQRLALLPAQQGAGRDRKGQPGREAEILQYSPVARGQQVGVAVNQAGKNRLAPPIHHLRVGIRPLDFPGRPHGDNPVFRDGDGRIAPNGAARVARYYGGIGDDGGHMAYHALHCTLRVKLNRPSPTVMWSPAAAGC